MKLNGVFRYPTIILGGLLALATLTTMNTAYSNVIDLIKTELALNYTQTGALMSAYFLGYAMGQIPWGMAADRYGSRLAITLSVLGVSLSTLMFGFSNSILLAAVSRFFAGLLGAGVFVPCVRLVSSWFNAEERGTALGVLNIGGSTGLVATSWVVPLLALSLGWRTSVKLTGVFGLLIAVTLWLLLREKEGTPHNPVRFKALPFNDRRFWTLALNQFIRLGSYYTFIAWLPLVLKEEYGLSVVATSTALSIFNIAGMFANPLGGVVSDRVGEKKVLVVSFLVIGVSVLGFSLNPAGVLLYTCVLILGWFINFVRSPAFTIIPRMFGTETAGSISGIHNTFAAFGALVLPFTLGLIRDNTQGYGMGWMAVAALAFIGSSLFSTLKVEEF